MTQPALKQDGIPDEVLRLAGQISAVTPPHTVRRASPVAEAEDPASVLARRFAPLSQQTQRAETAPAARGPVESAPQRRAEPRRLLTHPATIGAIAATLLAAGASWLAGAGFLSPGTGSAGGTRGSAFAGAALSIDVQPPVGRSLETGTRSPQILPGSLSGFAVRPGGSDRIEGLVARGNAMMAAGYLAGARAYYRRAAEAGSGQAALAAGATYDPDVTAGRGWLGIAPDRAEAATWYARAASLGIGDRDSELKRLRNEWDKPTPPALVAKTVPQAAQPAAAQKATSPKTAPAQAAAAPHGRAARPTETAAEPQNFRRMASNTSSIANAAKPRLLGSEGEPKPGPLSRLVQAAIGLSPEQEWNEVVSAVNIRKGPSNTAGTDVVAPKGTKLQVIGHDGNWVRIRDPKTQTEGYVYNRFLKASSGP